MSDWIRVVVCGAHMSGLPLNNQLTNIGGKLIAQTNTAPHYHLYKLAGFDPPRPGLIRVSAGSAIEVEVWEIPIRDYGAFVVGIPSPLGIGTIELEDGSQVQGFLCEAYAIVGAENISHYGGWRGYITKF